VKGRWGLGLVLLILVLAHVPGVRPAGAGLIVLQSDLGGRLQLANAYVDHAMMEDSPLCEPRVCLERARDHLYYVLARHPENYIAWTLLGHTYELEGER